MGVKPLKLLVLGFGLSEATFSRFTGKLMLRYWRRSQTKALAAHEIAERICHIPGDEPFTAALLEDIGVLVLLADMGEPFARLLSRTPVTPSELKAREVELLGFDHVELGGRLLASWGLSESIVAAVDGSASSRDGSSSAAAVALARIVQLANLLADLVIDGRQDVLAGLVDAAAPNCRLTQAQLSDLVASLQQRVALTADLFTSDLPPGLDYRDLLMQAHTRMADVSAELASELVKGNRLQAPAACDASETLADVQSLSTAVSQFIQRQADTVRGEARPAPRTPVAVQAPLSDRCQPVARRHRSPLPRATPAKMTRRGC